jgi:serine protease AprX
VLSMSIRSNPFVIRVKHSIAMTLVVLVLVSPGMAGLNITPSNGIVMTGADGIVMTGADGIVMTGADSFMNTTANGIVMTGADGIVMTGADGIVMTGADSVAYPNTFRSTSADGIVMTGADGIVMTGADGIVMTGADGSNYSADSVTVTLPNGIVMTGADGIVMTGADGVRSEANNGIVMTGADGIVMTGADGIVMTGADAVRATGTDGVVFSVVPDGLTFTGATGIVMTGADGIVMTGADGIVMTGADGLFPNALSPSTGGLQSVDPELALLLNRVTDDSNVNAAVVYHRLPTDSDLADLQHLGIVGGTRFHVLPVITLTATRQQLFAISRLPTVRSIYGNRTLTLTSEPEVRAVTGVNRAWQDTEIISNNRGLPVTGKNVTVAVLDTGIDGTHRDLSTRVTKNIKLASTQSVSVGFAYPINSENLSNTDQIYGHGTFVGGVIAGNGSRSGGKFSGVAPGARLVGLSAGDFTLLYVLEGFDYLLANGSNLGVKVVNCSFSTNSVFDASDPVNIATKMLTDAGISVVFSAGNSGSGAHTLNPYAAAPWVVSVGATDTQGRLASFSSRGDFADPIFHPTLVAPGVGVVSLRGSGIANVVGAAGLTSSDAGRLSLTELLYYTTASGTSFSAPQVTGAIALMLEANSNLTPAQVKDILQRTATPLPPYYTFETGTGMLNVHAAVLEAAFPTRRIGAWRGTLDRNQVKFATEGPTQFTGTVQPGSTTDTPLTIPAGALSATVQISWGPLWSANDLGLYVYDQTGVVRGQSNTLNLTGLNGKHESVTVLAPESGGWRIGVRNSLGAFGTSQQFYGTLEIGRALYADLNDIGSLSPAQQDEVYQSLRSFSMWPIGSNFRPDFGVSRLDLATALVLGGRIPQYIPGQPTYPDVRDASRMLFVESVQASPTGALFVDVARGAQFRPHDTVTRLVATVALVRAAGLRSDAESSAGAPLAFLDAASIPTELKGYVSLAVSSGLLKAESTFRPQDIFTRADLAHAISILQKRATATP